MRIPINSIYLATEGEGIFLGLPQVFVRFQGCHIGCFNCDSKETWNFSEASLQDIDHVIEEVDRLARGVKRISITGGDPLHPKNIQGLQELVGKLKDKHYWINLEASGTRIVHSLFLTVDFISYDVKTPSTGVHTPEHLIDEMAQHYPGRFQVKSVIETREDFDFVHRIQKDSFDFPWVLTPSYNKGEAWPLERIKNLLSLNEKKGGKFRVICQQHKIIYGSSRQYV